VSSCVKISCHIFGCLCKIILLSTVLCSCHIRQFLAYMLQWHKNALCCICHCLHITIHGSLHWFSLNMILGNFTIIYHYIPVLVEVWKHWWMLYVNTCMHLCVLVKHGSLSIYQSTIYFLSISCREKWNSRILQCSR